MDPYSKDKSFIGIFTTSTDLMVRVWDDAMVSMTGIEASDAVGKHITDIVPNIEARGLLKRFELVRDVGTTEVLAPALHKYLISCPPQNAASSFSEMRQLVTISALQTTAEIEGLIVMVEDVTARMERERGLASRLSDPDDTVRLQAATSVASGGDSLHSDDARPVINALADKNWRVRRRLVEGLAKRAAPDAVATLLEAVRKEHLDLGMVNSALQILQTTAVDTTETLVDFLRGDDHDLRMQAALALGKQNNKNAVEALLTHLDDEDANVRYHVIEALGNLRAAEAVDPLLRIAESRDFFLSFVALDALKQIGDPSIATRVSSLLDDDLLRDAATGTLGATGAVDAAERIVELLNGKALDPLTASRALCELFDRHEAASSSGDQIVARVQGAIRDPGKSALINSLGNTDTLATETIRVGGWIDDEEVRRQLAVLVDEETFRDASLNALASQGEPAIEILIEKLKSDNVEIRAASAHALGAIESPVATESLISALHSDPDIATSALEALGRSGSPKAIDALVELLASDDKALRRSTVNTLKRFLGPDISMRLHGLLADVDANVREAAVRLVGDLQTAESRAAVIACCNDSDELVRIAAIEQLASFPDGDAVKMLSESLNDTAPRVRAAAAQSLAAFGGDGPSRALHLALGDSDAWVRYFAIRSLAANGGAAKSRELFKDIAQADPAEQVRIAAAEAIG